KASFKMAFRVDFTEVAVEDLEAIAEFIAIDNPEAASHVCQGLYELSLSLGMSPFIGRITPEYKDPTIRDISRGKYRVVYLVDEQRECVQILRFWHGARGYLPD